MEKVKKLLELCRLNYEKVILVLSVLTLGLGVVALWFLSAKAQEEAEGLTRVYNTKKVKAPAPVAMGTYTAALEAARNPAPISFGLPHKVFTPVKWIKTSDGRIIVDRSGKSVGPEALKIDGVKALNMVVRLVSSGPDGHVIELMIEAADRAEFRKPRPFTVKADEKIRIPGGTARNPNQIWLREVKGAAENPDSLSFEITETKERFEVTKDKAFVRADAYVADLSYPPENRQFKTLRRDAVIGFGGEEYKIVEISENEVVVSNRLNDKKTRLKRTPQ
ncbi:MAG TPA: hypothetical protein DCM86_01065 [Verrucomicrobiales bacterium]|nr:hypothetical protein [Verrucomicrobiales bacterium]